MSIKMVFDNYYNFYFAPAFNMEDFQAGLGTKTFLLVLAVILITVWRLSQKESRLPPGPKGIPLLGYSPYLRGNRFKKLVEMARNQANIFTVYMGTRPVVFLNDWATIKEAIVKKGDLFSGRPTCLTFKEGYKGKDIVTTDGPINKEQRRFTLHQLRNFGFGKRTLDDMIMFQVNELIQDIKDKGKKDLKISDIFFIPIMNVIWRIVSGRNYSLEDDHIAAFSEIIKLNFTFLSSTYVPNFLPILRYLPIFKFKLFLSNMKIIRKFLHQEIEDHEKTLVDGSHRDLIDVYLQEILKRPENERKGTAFQKSRLVGTVADMFQAGIDTTADSLCWIFLYIATWPEIQRKVQEELDRVIGRDRLPTYNDRLQLPYTEAVILETQRHVTTVPYGIPHTPHKTAELCGYEIPKGTYVLLNLHRVHHDVSLWGDPEVFRPERFLDANGAVNKPEYFIPFSVGPRACIGESLAKVEMFLFFACLVHRFNFSYVTGEMPPSMKPIFAVTLRPPPFSLHIEPRD